MTINEWEHCIKFYLTMNTEYFLCQTYHTQGGSTSRRWLKTGNRLTTEMTSSLQEVEKRIDGLRLAAQWQFNKIKCNQLSGQRPDIDTVILLATFGQFPFRVLVLRFPKWYDKWQWAQKWALQGQFKIFLDLNKIFLIFCPP